MLSRVVQRAFSSARKPAVRVAVTGAAGAIGYATLFRIASGEMLGKDQPVILHCLELGPAMNALKGVAMELNDCAFPLLEGIVQTDDMSVGFGDVDYALLVGAKPRGPGMERGDLILDNGNIFVAQGKAINDNASKDVKVVVVGNPANTNALIAAHNAPNVNPQNFTAMTRLDHNRGLSQLAEKTGCGVSDVDRFCIWGNHSATQFPDITYASIGGRPANDVVADEPWVWDQFIPTVAKRGAAIIDARGASSAASAGSSAIDHIRDWVHGTDGAWTSMAVPSDGSYGVEEGLYYSYPVTCQGGEYSIVHDLDVSERQAALMQATKAELLEERDIVKDLLQ